MKELGLRTPKSFIAKKMEDAWEIYKKYFLCVISPSFTLGGQGGGIA